MLTRIILCITLAILPIVSALGQTAVQYPTDYRTWTHAKSMLIKPGHPLADPFAGIHHVYANSKAIEGLAAGRYENGAVFVFDLLDYEEADNAVSETSRKFIGVMEYNRDLYAATGGWGFEVFTADSQTERAVKDGGKACFACHTGAADSNYVFTRYRK